MTSPSVTPTPGLGTQANPALAPSVSPSDKLTKKEKKEQNREEKKELKRERQGLDQQSEVVSPSPHSSP